MFYDELTQLLEDVINNGIPDFAIKYVDNGVTYDEKNLISKNQVMGVVNLISSQVNSIKTNDEQRSRTDIYTVKFLVPLNSDTHQMPGYYESKIQDFIYNFNNQELIVDSCNIFISNCQITSMFKTDVPINGNDYENVTLQFQAIVSDIFIYGNSRILKIDDVDVDCVIACVFGVRKQYNSIVNSNGIVQNQNCGLVYSLTTDFIFNKNNTAHSQVLQDWMLTTTHKVTYKIASLNFERTCDISELTTNDITGDTIKIRVVFVEQGGS